ncbi:DHA2 family efflux MFS transporter permease subunit [Uliginosibacterium aquaticum]|uniref:DHA2 family efflux MFS transporter permease subunit n=1 Tax=Uliginosibacterium aquaticum TaxID=2731212 RepID=A0ABX2IGE7_9RHOO|nr:DHA2 family efflux MFS transporter permease subunit [Uliginosibacterium aquaticum]NSL55803.1 DHA2 family efflux MFS transporter permease subunit [Uliginosibacterium aquaticum]
MSTPDKQIVLSSPASVKQASPDTASPWPVFWVASIAVFLVSMDGTMLFAAFSALRAGFPQATAADLSWVLNAYTVVYAAMLIPSGGLADRHGRKKVFLLGVALFLVASAACGLASNVAWLVAARALQALGAALLTPASLSLVLAAFPANKRAVAVSLWSAVGGLAAAVGPSLGAFVVASLGWPWAFYLNLPLGMFAIWRGVTLLAEAKQPNKGRPLDLVGMGLLILGIGALALSIVQAESPDWSRHELLEIAGLGLASIAGFIAWARLASAPLVDLSLFRDATYRYVNLASLSFGIAFSMMFFAFFFYMNAIWHYSLPLAGIAMAPGPLCVVPVAALSGRLAGRYGHRPLLVVGCLIYGLSGLWFLLVPGTEPAYLTQWLPGALLSGMGVGMVLPSLSGAAVSHLPAQHYAVGSAINQAIRQIGSVMGVALTVLLLGGAVLSRANFDAVYLCHMSLALLTAALCLPVRTGPASLARKS